MTVVIALKHLGNLLFYRYTVAVLISGIVNFSDAVLIVLIGILFSFGALPIESFYIIFFISFL